MGENREQLDNSVNSNGVVVLPDGTKPIPMGSGFITGVLGKGGMAIVYKIWNDQLGVNRAIKLLRPNSTKENIERFTQEMRITAQLDHPNIIKIHTVGNWYGLPYIEMEMVDGVSLETLIEKQGKLPLELVVAISILVCKALDYTHNHVYTIGGIEHVGLLHRDLKPANILFSRTGKLRLTDFGIATPTNATAGTSSGKVVGSMQYLAPEQLEGDPADTRADIFSLGCVMYEMLTGGKAFPEKNIAKLIKQRLKGKYIPLGDCGRVIPQELISITDKTLALDKNKRFKSVKDILDKLNEFFAVISDESAEDVVLGYATGKRKPNDEEVYKKLRKKFPIVAIISLLISLFFIVATAMFVVFKPDIRALTEKYLTKPMLSDSTGVMSKKADDSVPEGNGQMEKKSKVGAKKSNTNRNGTVGRKKRSYSRRVKPVKRVRSVTKSAAPNFISDEFAPEDNLLTQLLDKYQTTDPVMVFKKEDAVGSYNNILALYDLLPIKYKNKKEIKLYRHRAIVKTGKANRAYFDNNHINDGEFYLSKAKFLYDEGQYQRAIWILKIVNSSPTALSNKQKLNNIVSLYIARCYYGIFKQNPSEVKRQQALDSWDAVKSIMSSSPSHPYYIEAVKAISDLKNSVVEE